MIKVLIADDEQKVCQLIYELVEWEKLGMQVVGLTYNGLEALSAIEKEAPDIVITDIRMPGCGGLEMIQRAKQMKSDINIIIVSGYKFFEYAQNAIKYGVSDYLIKPIKRTELLATLSKMKEQYLQQEQKMCEAKQIEQQLKNNQERIRQRFFTEVLFNNGKSRIYSNCEEINSDYYTNFREGMFGVLIIKIDYDYHEQCNGGVRLLAAKAEQLLVGELEEYCYDIESYVTEGYIYAVINFEKGNEKTIRKYIKSAFEQIAVQKSLFRQFCFSCAIGEYVTEIEQIKDSYVTACKAVEDRLINGTGKIYEKGISRELSYDNKVLLNKAIKEIRLYASALQKEEVVKTITHTGRELEKIEGGSGWEIKYITLQICENYAAVMKENKFYGKEIDELYENFKASGNQCGQLEELFECLKEYIAESMEKIAEDKRKERTRPIRTAKEYIHTNYMKNITLEEVGGITGFNASYFSALFKKEMGINFMEYIMEVRMDKAKKLLTETKDSVALVCEHVGYNDIKHFTKNFKMNTGLKPSVYRKIYS